MTALPSGAERVVAVYAGPTLGLPVELADAMLSDVIDLVTATPHVAPAVLTTAARRDAANTASWPGTRLVEVSDDGRVGALLAAAADPSAVAVAVVMSDAPDLPGLLLGKLFRSVSGRPQVAVCPAEPDALVAVAASLPLPSWLVESTVGFDQPDAVAALQAAGPPRLVAVVPGWHRIRSFADTARLDPGLEGWDATRLALSG
ncbi:MAG TPA: hypothetical protein VHW92_10765 [Mycobacteriales bacterium]|nr:hypothetical protein [Mycobacteriales bacterium]